MFFPKKDMDRSRIMHFFGRGGGVLNLGSNHDTPSGHKQLLCEIGTSNGFFKKKNMDWTQTMHMDRRTNRNKVITIYPNTLIAVVDNKGIL